MSEMLGNYRFLIRDYSLATMELEKSFHKSVLNIGSKKKLIICYTQTRQLTKALDLSLSLLKEDADCIILIDPEKEDCPCKNLIFQLESGIVKRENRYELMVELGILWLYCNEEKAVFYFNKAIDLDPIDERINQIISVLNSKIKKSRS